MAQNETVKKVKKGELAVGVLEKTTRVLPKAIEDAVSNGIPVILTQRGYLIKGFYGLETIVGHPGFAFVQETEDSSLLVAYDNKEHQFPIKSFEDLVKFNNLIWGVFYKISEQHKKPDSLWFELMLKHDAVSITPNFAK